MANPQKHKNLRLTAISILWVLCLASGCTHAPECATCRGAAHPSGPACQGLFWYDFSQENTDPDHYAKIDYTHWEKLRRTSNHIMIKQRDFGTDPDGWALLLQRIKEERWPGAIFLGNIDLIDGSAPESAEQFAELCLRIRQADIPLTYALYTDEPDLGPERYEDLSMREHLDLRYEAGKEALRRRGLDDIKLGQMWSLYGDPQHNWESRIDQHGWPKMDFIGCDGLYSGRPEHLHIVASRVNHFLERYTREVDDSTPIVLVLKAWSSGDEPPMTWEWLHQQLQAGLTGESPYPGCPILEKEYRDRIALVGFFHMKVDDPSGAYRSGGNTPGLIDGLAHFAAAHGWNMPAQTPNP